MRKLFHNIKRQITVFRGLPEEVEIEPTNRCNLACKICGAGNKTIQDPRGDMNLDNYTRLLDEIYFIHTLSLCGRGEPTLHPQVIEMIRQAHSRGFKTLINTNTNTKFFEHDENIGALVSSGLDKLHLSLDGFSQKSYQAFRKNGKLERVFRALEKLEKARTGDKPYVLVDFILNKYNQHEEDR